MNVLWFLILGAVAGWVAGEIVRGYGFGLLGNIIVGIIGALVGGLLFDFLNIGTYGFVGSLVMSVIGAVLFLFIVNALGKRTV